MTTKVDLNIKEILQDKRAHVYVWVFGNLSFIDQIFF